MQLKIAEGELADALQEFAEHLREAISRTPGAKPTHANSAGAPVDLKSDVNTQ